MFMTMLFLVFPMLIPGAGHQAGLEVLLPEWRYNPIGRPVIVQVSAGNGAAVIRLLDAAGNLLADPVLAERTRIDLGDALPCIWTLQHAAYLQLFVDGEATGSALVVDPMLSRLIPVTEDAVNPTGHTYSRITGWHDEYSGPGVQEGDPVSEDGTEEGVPRLCSGVRLYPEQHVLMDTTMGQVLLAMHPEHAPNTVWNFLTLCAGGFYRDIPFHRIVPMTARGDPFVIQAGDPTETGSGGPGYWLPMEKSDLPHDFGVLSMARDTDPDSAGSQIFFCLSRAGTSRLDGSYCAFGSTIAGGDTIRAIAGVELADVATGKPVNPPRIRFVRLVPASPRGSVDGVLPTSEPAAGEEEVSRPVRVPR